MKLIAITAHGLTVELDNTDAIALADACGYGVNHEIPGDRILLEALASALTAGALAAFALNRGLVEEREVTLGTLRELWAPLDTRNVPPVRVLASPQ